MTQVPSLFSQLSPEDQLAAFVASRRNEVAGSEDVANRVCQGEGHGFESRRPLQRKSS